VQPTLDGVCPWPFIPDNGTHGPHPSRSHGKRGPTAVARANGAVTWRSATIYGTRQPEPGLRPQHHLSITHDRYGSSSHPLHNGRLIHPQDIDAPLHIAAQRKINSCRQQYANMSFLPAILSTSTRMHGELLRLLFLQAHPENEAHFAATEMSSQRIQSAFYQSQKSKVGLAAAKAAALRINLNAEGCCTPNARSLSRSPSPYPPSFTQSPFPPR
jgi:hypothetical protein